MYGGCVLSDHALLTKRVVSNVFAIYSKSKIQSFFLAYIVISKIGIRFDSFLSVNNSIHSYKTRLASFFQLTLCRKNIRQFLISFQGSKFFNTLSYKIKTRSFNVKVGVGVRA